MTTRRRPRSARDKQWQLRPAAALGPDATLALAEVLDQHPEALHNPAALDLLATLVAQRDLTTPAAIKAFFHGDLSAWATRSLLDARHASRCRAHCSGDSAR